MTSSQYTSTYPPNLPFSPKYRDFISEFYRISDTPDAHDTYVSQFMPSARLVMGSKEANGSEGTVPSFPIRIAHQLTNIAEILALRKGLWEKVKTRSHSPLKIFPFGPDADEVMLYGIVVYEFKAGGGSGLEWAARGVLTEVDGKVVWKEYQVYGPP
jgi:hypothetical protein